MLLLETDVGTKIRSLVCRLSTVCRTIRIGQELALSSLDGLPSVAKNAMCSFQCTDCVGWLRELLSGRSATGQLNVWLGTFCV